MRRRQRRNGSAGLAVLGLAALAGLAACSTTGPEEPLAGRESRPDYGRGLAVYSAHCARCHDSGKFGAPTLKDVDEWDDRSFHWSSVLAEHVRRGFAGMPANGPLSERDIRDALHYMAVTIEANDE
jgi:cytochrome c5